MLFRFGAYIGSLVTAIKRAPGATFLICIITWLTPFAAQFVFHPGDMIKFVGLFVAWPTATPAYGELAALGTVLTLGVVLLLAVVTFYRAAGVPVPLWPIAAFVMCGIVGNTGWWIGRGAFDLGGALAGLSPTALLYFCESRALDFAFRPQDVHG